MSVPRKHGDYSYGPAAMQSSTVNATARSAVPLQKGDWPNMDSTVVQLQTQ